MPGVAARWVFWMSVAVAAPLAVWGAQTAGTARGGLPSTTTPVTGEPMAAVWRERHLNFVYLGRTVRYSCEGLRDKVRAMLIDLGARRDVKVAAIGCGEDDGERADTLQPSLDVIFSAPALPDPAARPLRVGDLAATDARFESFTIASDAFRNMGASDCELVQEFARQILPKLVTRNVKQDITCEAASGQTGSRFLVRGEILKTLPRIELPARVRSMKYQ